MLISTQPRTQCKSLKQILVPSSRPQINTYLGLKFSIDISRKMPVTVGLIMHNSQFYCIGLNLVFLILMQLNVEQASRNQNEEAL
jgi:hypothetical protein